MAFPHRFSPGDRWIACELINSKAPSVANIEVIPARGGKAIPVTDGRFWNDKPRWSPDGRTIYFVSNRTGLFEVWGRRFDPAREQPVGSVFRVTEFSSPSRMLSDRTSEATMALSAHQLVLPVTEISGHIWSLEDP